MREEEGFKDSESHSVSNWRDGGSVHCSLEDQEKISSSVSDGAICKWSYSLLLSILWPPRDLLLFYCHLSFVFTSVAVGLRCHIPLLKLHLCLNLHPPCLSLTVLSLPGALGQIVSPPSNLCVEVLTPRTSECDRV